MARIDPFAWRPPHAPRLEGSWAVNHALDRVERWPLPQGAVGPESVALDGEGALYTGVEDGRILRFPPGGGAPEALASTGGRPLGIEVDRDGTLVVCDPERGLLRVHRDGRVDDLVTGADERPLGFANNASIATDGTIYFSDSTDLVGVHSYRTDLLEHRPRGRIYAYQPGTGEVRLVVAGLWFANGVALSGDGTFLVVAETGRYRLTRVWLTGAGAGEREVLLDNLPGFPDNVTRGDDGLFWVALANPRNRLLDLLLPRPRLRRLVAAIPEGLQPQPRRYGFVVAVTERGDVVHQLQGPAGAYAFITGVRRQAGWLYLGSLDEDAVARVPAP